MICPRGSYLASLYRVDIGAEESFAGVMGEIIRASVKIMDEDKARWIMHSTLEFTDLDLIEGVLHGGGDVDSVIDISSYYIKIWYCVLMKWFGTLER